MEYMPRYTDIVETLQGLGAAFRAPWCVYGREFPDSDAIDVEHFRFINRLFEKEISSAESIRNINSIGRCGDCVAKSRCPGVPEIYLRAYGDAEFRPL